VFEVYVKYIIDGYLEEIVREMEEIIWIGIENKIDLSTKVCVGLFYNTPLNSGCYKVNFIRDLNEEMNMLIGKYSNAGVSITLVNKI